MKRPFLITVILILLVSLCAFFYLRTRSENSPVEFITTRIHIGTISNDVTATGTVQPVDTVAVGSQVSGTIKKIYVDFNSVVKNGQLIAELDKSLLRAEAEQYSANLQSMESQLIYEKQNLDRQTTLYNAGGISKADYETAQNQYKTALASVGSVKAQLSAANKNLSYADIRSPISGTILSRNVSEGQTVAASFNTPVLFSIAKDLTKMQVRAAVDEADVGNVAEGDAVSFTVDAFPDENFNGTVQEVRLQPVVTANVVTYVTIINAPNPDKKLKPGMTANVTITTREIKNAGLIPAQATGYVPNQPILKEYNAKDSAGTSNISLADTLQPGQKLAAVWVLQDNKLINKKIITGMNDGVNVQVIKGLDEKDLVIEGVREKKKKDKPDVANSPFIPSRRPPANRPGS